AARSAAANGPARVAAGATPDASAPRASSPGREAAPVVVEVRGRGEGWLEIALPAGLRAIELADRIGETPLPPYIRRPEGPTDDDATRYQTVFAREPGSIAAPTAGLHLTEALIERLRGHGIGLAEVVLHVGPATFLAGQPGRGALAVEPERYLVPPATRDAIERTKSAPGGRVIAVGTTTTRALESAARAGWPDGLVETSLVLSPGSRFEVLDGLLTNFHLPGSSLLALVAGFAGVDGARAAYEAAVARGYRFYSYGDAMLIL
ncbi:MAG: S-adenosylmethionine:tRNA ribosyltransferase-isomerase, partial [Alphaproteobacteria bacterium]